VDQRRNVRGVLNGIAAVLPVMKAQGSGHVVNVSSTLGIEVIPTSAVYSATKAAVRVLSEGLRREHQEIRVSVVSLSLTESELVTKGGDPDTMAYVQNLAQNLNMPTSIVADAIACAIDQPGQIDVNEIVIRPLATVG
jgi:NADP-dependent 3-hydroxy acid dehydrogenase YdfG